ncbi:hypothetical protein, partial [uncultured Victivallis sp.]|uniref:hypothetical protein n=1 Tax=uncultured Victivallis sp. TaxID=354118 RepID=UPI0025E18919
QITSDFSSFGYSRFAFPAALAAQFKNRGQCQHSQLFQSIHRFLIPVIKFQFDAGKNAIPFFPCFDLSRELGPRPRTSPDRESDRNGNALFPEKPSSLATPPASTR